MEKDLKKNITDTPAKKPRRLQGIVIKNKMDQTAVVRVDRLKIIPKYQKRIMVNRKYKCHDPKKTFKVGETVIIEACRPISKDKKWRIIGRVKTDDQTVK